MKIGAPSITIQALYAQLNIEARSPEQCSHRKALNFTCDYFSIIYKIFINNRFDTYIYARTLVR